jgi:hypothetical protein
MSPMETPQQEITRLKLWIDQLQSGMYINCVYCGHCYGPKDKVPSSMADALKLHIAQCPQHPMHSILKTLKAGRDLVSAAFATVSHGGPTKAEARVWIEEANRVIDQAEMGGSLRGGSKT